MPVVYGSCDMNWTQINGQRFQFALISRRSRFRAGTRYFTRGIDTAGHVGNYNETEQIVITESNSKTAFVQTRGSVPLFWAEVNNLKYKPDLLVMDRPDAISALKTHLEEQVSLYGTQTLVNLLNSTGYEKPVQVNYEEKVKAAAIPSVEYHHFDFHKECKNMRWDRISTLIDQLEPELQEKGCVVSFGRILSSLKPPFQLLSRHCGRRGSKMANGRRSNQLFGQFGSNKRYPVKHR
jgi:phosphatidylinositol 4-phosphatase